MDNQMDNQKNTKTFELETNWGKRDRLLYLTQHLRNKMAQREKVLTNNKPEFPFESYLKKIKQEGDAKN